MRKPLARLQILLLERRIQHPETPYLPRARRVVALDVGFGFAVCGLQGEGTCGLDRASARSHSESLHGEMGVGKAEKVWKVEEGGWGSEWEDGGMGG